MSAFGTRLVIALTLALTASVLVASPTQAEPARWRGVIVFAKNPDNPFRSVVRWRLYRIAGGKTVLRESAQWRAGSGMGGAAGRNSCVKNKGWLPNGTYRVRHHHNYGGNLIKGRAFQVDDKRCPNGTRRTALFLHTEQGDRSRQCPDRRGDQVCRWEVPKYNDYKSAGCIKISPGALKSLSDRYLRVFRSGVRYAKGDVVLKVVG